jgi:ubiquinone/menaquinone biosynthesis C-methylase UbiE
MAKDGLARVRDAYDRMARHYDRDMERGLTRRLVQRARPRVGQGVRGRLLEVGIGTGLSLAYYPPEVQVTGIDLSPQMLKHASQRAQQLGREVDLRLMDAQALDFPDHGFDSVAFNLCLCSIPHPERALSEAVRVAVPGAPMVFLEHVRSNRPVLGLVQDLINPLTVWLQADYFNRRTEELIRAQGITVTSADRWALGVMTLITGRAP